MPRMLTQTDNLRLQLIFCFRNHYSIPLSPLKRNVSARISLRGLHRLIWLDALRRDHNVGFLVERLICLVFCCTVYFVQMCIGMSFEFSKNDTLWNKMFIFWVACNIMLSFPLKSTRQAVSISNIILVLSYNMATLHENESLSHLQQICSGWLFKHLSKICMIEMLIIKLIWKHVAKGVIALKSQLVQMGKG